MMHQKMAVPCSDCDDGYCVMNCGPAIKPQAQLHDRARRAIVALREPNASLARVPNTVRQSIADVIEELLGAPSP